MSRELSEVCLRELAINQYSCANALASIIEKLIREERIICRLFSQKGDLRELERLSQYNLTLAANILGRGFSTDKEIDF